MEGEPEKKGCVCVYVREQELERESDRLLTVICEGNVKNEFGYHTLLSWGMAPHILTS